MIKIIDSHVHVWEPTRFHYAWLEGELNTPFLPADLPHVEARTRGAVFVQADCRDEEALAEVDWVSSLGPVWPALRAIVAAVQIELGDKVAGDLDQLRLRPLVKGVRRLFQDRDDSFILSPQTLAGARSVASAGLTFDACIRFGQLTALAEFAARVPELSIVLDHMGKPRIGDGHRELWSNGLRQLALQPNVTVKLSGAEADPGRPLAPQALPFIEETLQVFGAGRCMIGSDWPVSIRDSSGYEEWNDLILDRALTGASDAELEDVAWGTAARFYGLEKG
ncbi:amidohydrolase family protein [Arthrobacter sp. 92]|uniref:amidohydrolase family protein n=1 Tax=Arthrobacter sp. 92 TaxID=3418175 RepID=UPI003CFD3052